jgi:hypothetical protein
MSLYIRLNKELDANQLIKQISKEIGTYKGGKLKDSFLCIEVKTAQDTVCGVVKDQVEKLKVNDDRENQVSE